MLRFLKRRRYHWLRNVVLAAAVGGMCVQMWYVPQILAQESAALAGEEAMAQQLREERTSIDLSAPLQSRQRQLVEKLDRFCAESQARASRGSELEELAGDVDVYIDHVRRTTGELQARIAALREKMVQAGVDPSAVSRLDTFTTELRARANALIHDLRGVRQFQGDPAMLADRTDRLRQRLHPPETLPAFEPADGPILPRRPMRVEDLQVGRAPFYRFPWQLAGPDDLIGDLLAEVAGGTPASGPATAADRAEACPEVVFAESSCGDQADADLIRAKAESLENDPVRIFEFVRNNIAFEPYAGSVKGAARTLREGAGNDIDLASLLISLYRAAGFNARYEFGTIRLDPDEAAAWLAVDDPVQAVKALRQNGVPVEPVYDAGVLSAVLVDHVWVKAFVDVVPYRGAEPGEPDTWVEMDPSYKRHTTIVRELESALSMSPSTLLTNAQVGAQVGPDSATHLNGQLVDDQIGIVAARVRDYLASFDLEAEAAFRQKRVAEELFGILPISDAYSIQVRGMSFSRLPDALRHRVRIQLVNRHFETLLDTEYDLQDLIGEPVTLLSVPTAGTQSVLDRLEPVDLDEVNGGLDVIPELRIDDATTSASAAVGLGEAMTLEISFQGPGVLENHIIQPLRAGGVHAIVFNAQHICQTDLDAALGWLEALAGPGGMASLAPGREIDQTVGRALHALGLSYYHQIERLGQIAAGSLGVIVTRHPSVTTVSWDVVVTENAGMATTVTAGPVRLVVGQDVQTATAALSPDPENDFSPEAQYLFTSALTANALETNALLQSLRGREGAGASMINAIEIANGAGMPVYTVTGSNLAGFDLNLIPGDVRDRVIHLAQTDHEVTFAADPVAMGAGESPPTYHGFIARNVTTGASDLVLIRDDAEFQMNAEVAPGDLDFPASSLPSTYDFLAWQDGAGLSAAIGSTAQWLRVLVDATTSTGLWYLPAIIDVNDWFSRREALDPVTTVLSAMAMAEPVGRFSSETGILNVVAKSGNPEEGLGDWVRAINAAEVVGELRPNEYRITADLSRESRWRATIRREGDTAPAATIEAATGPVEATFIFGESSSSADPTRAYLASAAPADLDGWYTFEIEPLNDLGDTRTGLAVGGRFRVDLTPPEAALRDEANQQTPFAHAADFLVIDGVADDANFGSYALETVDASTTAATPLFTSNTAKPSQIPAATLYLADLDLLPLNFSIRLTVTDRPGNVSVIESIAQVNPLPGDRSAPLVALSSVHDGAGSPVATGATVTTGTLAVTVDASDNASPGEAGIARLDLRIDGSVVDSETDFAAAGEPPGTVHHEVSHTFTIPLYQISNGPHTIEATAVDGAGKPATTSPPFEFRSTSELSSLAVNPSIVEIDNSIFTVTASTSPNSEWIITVGRGTGSEFAPVSPLVERTVSAGEQGQILESFQTTESGAPLASYGSDGTYVVRVAHPDSSGQPDLAGLQAFAAFEVNLQDRPPIADITNVAEPPVDSSDFNGAAGTPSITTGIFQLLGVAEDPDGGRVSYAIELRRPGEESAAFIADPPLLNGQPDPAPYEAGKRWTFRDPASVPDGFTEEVDGRGYGDDWNGSALAELDFTLVPNGTYDLVLRVVADPTEAEPVIRRIIVDSPLKVGQFAFSQQDAVVPTGGIPLTIVRSYNSFRRGEEGPFGFGWTFAVNDLDIDLGETRAIASDLGYSPVSEFIDSQAGDFSLRNDAMFNRNVTLTLPDGRRVTFAFGLKLKPAGFVPGWTYRAIYQSPPGVGAHLDTLIQEDFIAGPDAPYWQYDGVPSRPQHHDFTGWVLTTEDGTKYRILRKEQYEAGTEPGGQGYVDDTALTIAHVCGDPYLDSITTPNGDSIHFDYDMGDPASPHLGSGVQAVTFSAPDGSATRQIAIAYEDTGPDGPRRIKAIYGPGAVDGTGQPDFQMPPAFWYNYDEVGNLTEVHRIVGAPATWPEQGDPQTNEPPPRVPQSVSGDGWITEASVFLYDDDDRDPGDHIVTSIRDPRGLQPIVCEYDDDGRLIGTVDAYGNRIAIDHQIDGRTEVITDRGDPLAATVHVYDDRGNVTLTIDPAGRRIERTYTVPNEWSTIPADLLLTETINGELQAEYEYDSHGNQIRVTNAEGETTLTNYTYNIDTDLISRIETTDPAGTVTINVFDVQQNLRETHAGRQTVYTEYDSSGRLFQTSVSIDDGPEQLQTQYAYDSETGDLTSITQYNDPATTDDDTVQTFGYDARGNQVYTSYFWINPSNATDTARVTNWTDYDNADRAIATYRNISLNPATVDPPEATDGPTGTLLTQTVYNAAGQAIISIDHLGDSVTTMRYDARGNIMETATWPRLSQANLDDVALWLQDPAATDDATDPAHDLPDVLKAVVDDSNPYNDPIVTRSVYDGNGRPTITTDQAVYPDYPAAPVASLDTFGSRTQYDAAGRARASSRIRSVAINIVQGYLSPAGPNAPQGVANGLRSEATGDWEPLTDTETHYDALGRVGSTIDAAGAQTDFEYDDAGRQTAVIRTDTDENGLPRTLRTEFEYDDAGRQEITRDPRGTETRFRYDPLGRRTHTFFGDNRPALRSDVETVYDARGRRVASIDQMQQRTDYEYDDAGRLAAVVLPEVDDGAGGRARPRYEYEYDAYGNLLEIRDPLETRAVAADPNLTTIGRVTTFGYDHLHRQVSRTMPWDAGAASGATPFTPSTIDDDDDVTEYKAYDEQGRVVRHLDFEGNLAVYTYDQYDASTQQPYDVRAHYAAAAVAAASIDATNFADADVSALSFEIEYRFFRDELGRQDRVEQTYAGESPRITQWTYDARGRVMQIQSPEGTLVYGYDELDRRTSVEIAGGDPVVAATYTYDLLGRLSTVTRDGGGTYTYSYNDLGAREGIVYPDGTRTEYVYDDLSRLEELINWKPSGTEFFSDFDYTMRADGRRTGVVETRSAGADRTLAYDYDELNRLIQETSIAASPGSRPELHYKHEYAFDLAGNRLTKSESVDNGSGGWRVAREVAYTYDHRDRLLVERAEFFDNLGQATGAAATDFDYNRNGFLTRKALTLSGSAPGDDELFEFTPNSQDRLTAARRTMGGVGGVGGEAGALVAFRYNAAGVKVSRAIDGVLDYTCLIDPGNPTGYAQVIQEREWQGGLSTPKRSYVIGDDVLSQIEHGADPSPDVFTNLLYDGHGSTRDLVPEADSTALASYDYDSYGNALGFDAADLAAALTNLLYCGEQFDQSGAVAMYYLRARWYDVGVGRFGRMDPATGSPRGPSSLHKYAYVRLDPVSGVDPNGLFGLLDHLLSATYAAWIRAGYDVSLDSANNSLTAVIEGIRDGQSANGILLTASLNALLIISGGILTFAARVGGRSAGILLRAALPVLRRASRVAELFPAIGRPLARMSRSEWGSITFSSTRLRRNLISVYEASGARVQSALDTYLPDLRAHHVIPREFAGHDVIRRLRLNLDDVSNGLFVHVTQHLDESNHRSYNQVMREALDQIQAEHGMRSIGPLLDAVTALRDRAETALRAGAPLAEGHGSTVDFWRGVLLN